MDTPDVKPQEETVLENSAQEVQPAPEEEPFHFTIRVPNEPENIMIMATPRETVQDIKQSVMELPETCAHSCFSLSLNGVSLNEFMELAEIEGLEREAQLDLVQDNYTERDVRLHINRLRDLLGGPFKANPSAVGVDPALSLLTAVTGEIDEKIVPESEQKMEDIFSDEPVPEHAFTNTDLSQRSLLSEFVPATLHRDAPVCLQALSISGWNPVPFPRRLKGDLLYLTASLVEGEVVHITANTQGFTVNQSSNTRFNPDPRPGAKYTAHSLITLLQQISPQFQSNFGKLQEFITRHHMFEILPMSSCLPSHPWAVQPPHHVNDPTRPADAWLNFGTDAVDSLRDWNDELQSHRELPRSTLQERILRERLIAKVQTEFADAAMRGAMSVVHGTLTPLNPLEPEESHMYVYNNIFLSKGSDGRGSFAALGGDDAGHVATGKDLEGVKMINSVDPEGLNTLGTVVIDYKGVRVVAQSIVPGIFRRQADNSIVYGSADNGEVITADEGFHEAIGESLAKSLHLQPHLVSDAKDATSTMYTSMEVKGLLGADGRRYLLDLYRLNPVDIEFQEAECDEAEGRPAYPHKLTLLRPELMSLFWEHKFRAWVKTKSEAIRLERENNKTDKVKESTAETTPEAKEDDVDKENSQDKDEAINIDVSEFQLNFNADVFTPAKLGGTSEEIKSDEDTVREASKFLREEVIPSLVLDFASYSISPLDGEALAKSMHQRGINMRYLGKIAELISLSQDKRIEHIHSLAIQEMVVRSCKRLLRKELATCSLELSSQCVSHVLNCLFGKDFHSKPQPCLPSGVTKNDYHWAHFTSESLRRQLEADILVRFSHVMKENDWKHIKTLPLLREICLRVGIQIQARDYRFHALTDEERAAISAEDAAARSVMDRQQQQQGKKRGKKGAKQTPISSTRRTTTFIPDDIISIVPIVKQATMRSVFAEETFEAGKMSLAQGQRQLGLELLLESLALHEQTYGFLHSETSKCYATLAMIYHHGEDREAALDLQRKAVVASERTNGVDHPETLHHYLNLGLFEHAAGRSKLALRYLRHALYYWDIVFGAGHPDSATADNNAGVMLQTLRDYALSTVFFERACNTQESILGREHVITATGYHVLAKAYTLQGDFRKALNAERVAYGVFERKLGAEDPRTKESDIWLKELTSNALIAAKRAQAQVTQQQQLPKNHTTSAKAVPIMTNGIDSGKKYGLSTNGINQHARKKTSGKRH